MNTKKKRVFSMAVCILFIFVTFASLFYIVKEENHYCTGEDCPICANSSSRADIKECREWYDYDCNHKSDADIVCTIDNRSVFNCF